MSGKTLPHCLQSLHVDEAHGTADAHTIEIWLQPPSNQILAMNPNPLCSMLAFWERCIMCLPSEFDEWLLDQT